MSSFATLSPTAAYLALLQQISDRDIDLSKALDPATTSVTTPATSMVRFNSANKRWETYTGSAWAETIAAATDAYNISVTGLRGGNIYGTVTNNGTISGGTVNATVLQVAGSAAWTAASLTNLNQLTNGPAYITATALSPYAPLASPSLTGVPVAPTAAVDTNTTQLASTQFVLNQSYLKAAAAAAAYAPLASPTLTGVPTAPTAAVDTNTLQLASTQFVLNQSYLKAATASTTYAPLNGTGATGSWNITAANATALPAYSAGGASSAMTGRTGRAGVYSYNAITDPNTPTSYVSAIGFGNGSGGSAEIASDWVGNGGVWHRSLRDTTDSWTTWKQFLDSGNYNSFAPTLTGTGATGSWNVTAAKGSTLAQNGGAGTAMTFNWSGQSGQPSWLWGGSDGVNFYVYNPSNFSVASAAACSGNAASASAVPWTGVSSRPTALSQFSNDVTLGAGQAWTNVLASRASGTTYTNSTGRSIELSVSMDSNSGTSVVVGGVTLMSTVALNQTFCYACVIPIGAAYRVSSQSGISIWAELR